MNSTSAGDSSDAVVSNDDLLTEILLRLPLFSLRVFKLVSKRWLTLITNPNFTRRRNQSPMIDPPSGLFLKRESLKYDFVPLDVRVPPNRSPLPTTFNFRDARILQSCNGLLLGLIRDDKFFVYNPTINRFKTIPQCQFDNFSSCIGCARMAFDPSKSPHYKLLHPLCELGDHGHLITQIQIYSSKTCNWSVCGDRFPYDCFSNFGDGIYWNGAIHWLHRLKKSLHIRLDVEKRPSLTIIKKPTGISDKYALNQKLFQSCGSLLLCTGLLLSGAFIIFEMCDRYSGWSVRYHVNLYHIIPKTACREVCLQLCRRVRCIMIGKQEEDSFLVVEICGKIVQYNIVSKTISKYFELERFYTSACFEFIASSSAV